MAQTVGEIEVLIGGDAADLEKELREAEAVIKKLADKLTKQGDKLSEAASKGAKAAAEARVIMTAVLWGRGEGDRRVSFWIVASRSFAPARQLVRCDGDVRSVQ